MKFSVRRLVFAAMMAAIVCATTLLHLPLPLVGYVHAGDAFVLLCGFLLPAEYGFLAAGIGSAIADVLLSYAVYAPASFVIKGAVAFVAAVLFGRACRKSAEGRVRFWSLLAIGLFAELLVVAGYFVYELLLYRDIAMALPGLPMNAVQGAFGAVLAAFLMQQMTRFRLTERFLK